MPQHTDEEKRKRFREARFRRLQARRQEQPQNPFAAEPEADRSGVENFARGVGAGVSQSAAGIPGLIGSVLPGDDFFDRTAERLEVDAPNFFDPQGKAGKVGQFIGRAGGEAVQVLAGGAGILKLGATRALPALIRRPARLARVALRRGNRLKQAAASAALFSPVEFLIGASRAEEGESKVASGLKEAAFGAAAAGGFALIGATANAVAGSVLHELGKRSRTIRNFADPAPPLQSDVFGKFVMLPKKASGFQRFVTLWKAGLLTNPKTQVINAVGNTTFAALEATSRAPAAFFDRLLNLAVNAPRTRVLAGPKELLTGARAALKGGQVRTQRTFAVQGERGFTSFDRRQARAIEQGDLKEVVRNKGREVTRIGSFRESMRGAQPITTKADLTQAMQRGETMGNAFLDVYTRSVFRLLSATDQFFKGISMEQSFRNQLKARGLNMQTAGKLPKGRKALEAFVDNRMASRTFDDQMVGVAIGDAHIATFTDKNKISEFLNDLVEKVPALEFFFPFRTTPSALVQRVIDYSPVGAIMGFSALRRAAKAKHLKDFAGQLTAQRQGVDLLGRATTGLFGLVSMGWMLGEMGLLTGDAPKFGTRERQVFDAAGKQANSIILPDGQWHKIGNIAPAGNLIAMGATIRQLVTGGDPENVGKLGLLGASLTAGAKSVAEQPFFTGMRELLSLMQNPATVEKFAEDMASSFVPAAVGALARTLDDSIRERDGVAEAVISRLPFLSRTLPDRQNVFGEKIVRTPGVWANMFDPTTPRKATDNPLIAEMARLKVGVPEVRRIQFSDNSKEPQETFQLRQRIFGQTALMAAQTIMQSAVYGQADAIATSLQAQFGALATRIPLAQMRGGKAIEQALIEAWGEGKMQGDDIRRILLEWSIDTARGRVSRMLR